VVIDEWIPKGCTFIDLIRIRPGAGLLAKPKIVAGWEGVAFGHHSACLKQQAQKVLLVILMPN
jgi:hypothetical protein